MPSSRLLLIAALAAVLALGLLWILRPDGRAPNRAFGPASNLGQEPEAEVLAGVAEPPLSSPGADVDPDVARRGVGHEQRREGGPILRGRVVVPREMEVDPTLEVVAYERENDSGGDARNVLMRDVLLLSQPYRERDVAVARAPVENGRFELRLEPGKRVVWLMLDGRFLRLDPAVRVELHPEAEGEPGDLVLEPVAGAWVYGQVNPPRAGHAGLLFDHKRGMHGVVLMHGPGPYYTEVDAEGRFEFRAVQHGVAYHVFAREPTATAEYGPALASSEILQAGHQESLELTLPLGSRVSGYVRYQDDSPAAGVPVRVGVASERMGWGFGFAMLDAQDVSGPDGSFTLRGLPTGDWPVQIPGCGEVARIVANGEEQDELALSLSSETVVAGRVWKANGEPAAHAWIEAHDETGRRAVVRRADGEGRFALACVKGSVVMLSASITSEGATIETPSRVRVPVGTRGVELHFNPRGGVRGIARDEAGVPLQAFVLVGRRADGAEGTVRRSLETVDGRFVAASIPPGRWSFRVQVDGDEGAEQEVDVVVGERVELELTLDRSATVTVMVVDPAGLPVQNAEVFETRPGETGAQRLDERTRALPGSSALLRTDAEGKAVLPAHLREGGWVYADAEGWAPSEDALLSDVKGEEPLIIRLRQGGTLVVNVLAPPESEDPQFLRLIHREAGLFVAGALGNDRRFVAHGLAPGRWTVSLDNPRVSANSNITAGEESYVQLGHAAEEAVRVTGTLRLGGELAEGEVFWRSPAHEAVHRAKASISGYEIILPGPGTYLAYGTVDEGESMDGGVREVTGPLDRHDFDVPTGSISGKCIGPDGTPLIGRVVLQKRGGQRPMDRMRRAADEAGAFAFKGLTRGTYDLVFTGRSSNPTTVALVSGEGERAATVLRHTVVLAEGEAAETQLTAGGLGLLSVTGLESQTLVTLFDEAGLPLDLRQGSRFSLPPGTYSLEAWGERTLSRLSEPFDVVANQFVEISAELEPAGGVWVTVREGGRLAFPNLVVVDSKGVALRRRFYRGAEFGGSLREANGAIFLGPLFPGSYELVVDGPGEETTQRTIEVQAGRLHDVVVDL